MNVSRLVYSFDLNKIKRYDEIMSFDEMKKYVKMRIYNKKGEIFQLIGKNWKIK
jgi:hypothetical protein